MRGFVAVWRRSAAREGDGVIVDGAFQTANRRQLRGLAVCIDVARDYNNRVNGVPRLSDELEEAAAEIAKLLARGGSDPAALEEERNQRNQRNRPENHRVYPRGMTTKEYAEMLGISPRAVIKRIAAGKLVAAPTPRGWLIDVPEVDRLEECS
jgi:hypothetical protein